MKWYNDIWDGVVFSDCCSVEQDPHLENYMLHNSYTNPLNQKLFIARDV